MSPAQLEDQLVDAALDSMMEQEHIQLDENGTTIGDIEGRLLNIMNGSGD